MANSEKKMLRVKEFSEKYNIHTNIIYNHIHDGTLPAYKIAGVYFLDEDEVREVSKVKQK